MTDPNTVGTDIGSPPQNPVYRQDPFEESQFQQAVYQEGTGRQELRSGLGFGIKPKRHQIDPFEDPNPRASGPRRYYGQEDLRELAAEIAPESLARYDEENPAPPPVEEPTRLEGYQETGELTTENVPDVYSLTEAELPEYGIDINADNIGEAPEGIVSGWNDEDGDGYDDDGHAMGTHGAVNVQTAQGEQSIQDVLDDAGREPGLIEQGVNYAERLAQPGERTIAGGQDVVTTSPGGAISAALPPGFGAVAAIGGAISARNLNNIHEEYGNYQGDTGMGYIPRDQLDAGTPLAISEGFIPGTSVVSGNTDLAIRNNPALDVNGDGQLNAIELRDAIAAREAVQAEEARQAEIQRLEEQRAYAAAEEARRQAEAAEAARQAELTRQQRAAEEAARREAARQEAQRAAQEEARRQEDARRAEAQRRANESGREQSYGSGQAVTDRHGNAVRDSRGGVVTDNRTTVQPERDSGGGGGGGDSCFAADSQFLMENGEMKNVQDIKVGDRMAEGGRVYGILQGDGSVCDWYRYGNVYVTGSHFVLEDTWVPVAKSEGAELVWGGFETWYCVLNENHRMISEDYFTFTDFDAVDSVNDELEERLNGEH